MAQNKQCTGEHLDYLTVPELKKLCGSLELPIGSKDRKEDVVGTLLDARVTYGDLTGDMLQRICKKLSLPFSGTKTVLSERLTQGIGSQADELAEQLGKMNVSGTSSQFESLPYKELQAMCKDTGLPAGGKKEVLIERLSAHSNTTRPRQQPQQQPAATSPKSKRVALCVGVSNYGPYPGPLRNASKDAADLAAALRKTGCDAAALLDPTRTQMKEAIDKFCNQSVKPSTELAIFSFAGHGAFHTSSGKHIMMARCWGSDESDDFAKEAAKHGYAIEDVVKQMESRGCSRNLLFIDACRNPEKGKAKSRVARSAADESDADCRGWSSCRVPRGNPHTLICNACKNLHTACDGEEGKNGLYTEALLKHLFKVNHPSLWDAIESANAETHKKSGGAQQPIMEVSVSKPFREIKL